MTIERRREPRVESDLEILVWGIDARGMPFAQTALARNISRQGALLSGLRQVLRCGDLVAVQYRKERARFRVVWTRSNGDTTQAAVQKLEHQQCPWPNELQTASRGASPIPATPAP